MKTKAQKKKKSLFKRLVKWTGITFFLLIILIILLPILFKDEIVQFIKEEANASLNAELDFGKVDLSLLSTFPKFSLEINDLTLTGVDEFEGVELVEIKQTNLKLNLWSVIGGDQYEISSVGLVEPKIHVLVLSDGKANYDIATSDSTGIESIDEEVGESAPLKLALEEYYIEKGSIVYDDQLYLMYLELDGLNHKGSAAVNGTTYLVETLSDIGGVTFGYDNINYLSQTVTDIKCNMEINMPENEMKFIFKENEVVLNELGISLDGWFLMTDESMDMDINFGATKQSFSSLLSMVPGVYSPDFGNIKTNGNLLLEGRVFGEFSEKSMPGFNLDLSVSNAWFQYPDLPGKVDEIGVDVKVNREAGIDLNNTKVDINKLHLAFAGNEIDASLKLRNMMTDPNIESELKTFLDLSKLVEIIPLEEGESYSGTITTNIALKGNVSALEKEEYENFKANGNLKIAQMNYQTLASNYSVAIDSMLFQFAPQYLNLSYFEAKIGESDLHADGAIDNYMEYFLKNEVLTGSFNIASNYFNVDELMYADPNKESEKLEEPASAITSDSLVAETIDIPDNINFNLTTRIEKMVYDSLEVSNFTGGIVVNEGLAILKGMKMNVFDGSIGLNGSYNSISKDRAHIDMKMDIKDLDIPSAGLYFNTMEKMVPMAKYCKGNFSTSLNMVTDIDANMEPIYETTTGNGKVRTNKVVIRNLPVLIKISEALKMDKLKTQTLDNVNITYAFKDGKIWIDPFDVKMGEVNTTIQGTTSFLQELDYTMEMEIPQTMFGAEAAGLLSGLSGVGLDLEDNIPVKIGIRGTAVNPIIKTDLKNQAKNVADEAIEKVKDKVYDEAKKILEDAQKQADKLIMEAKAKADQIREAGTTSAEKIRKESLAAGNKTKREGKKAAEKIREEGHAQAQKLIDNASNPIKKKAAEIAAKQMKDETNKKADKMISEANIQGKKVISAGESKANKIKSESEVKAQEVEETAQLQADKIMSEANAKAEKIKE
ncbi:MAG: AsmA-like C-terminal region-containing protein [Flavobacteriales bacterium]|nr:AsmA-like C-terminal region-containing protein [Flavobacteriales bacterium]